MRILAIDYGEKRIGLAVSDEMGITARGISVIERKSKRADLDAIAAAVSEYGAGAIVVGYPLNSADRRASSAGRWTALLPPSEGSFPFPSSPGTKRCRRRKPRS